jgi:acetoacetate decarboxylase
MAMSDRTTGTKDEHYNVISVLYHALQGADTCATYLQDAEQAGDQELAQFFREVQGTYRRLGEQSQTLLRQRLR